MKLVAIVCVCLAVCEALQVAKEKPVHLAKVFQWAADPSAPLNCTTDTNWGLWIDGRDAHKGQYAYTKPYNKEVEPVFQMIYSKVAENEEPGLPLLTAIADMCHEHFSLTNTPHHLTSAVANCLRQDNKAHFAEVMEDVMTLPYSNGQFHFSGTKGEQITTLFDEYNSRQRLATAEANQEDQLKALAFLMHNLAFAHPLTDHNGRSRLLMTQHELRRLNLGCGTFMYNNNRDMTFNTVTETVGKLKEGMLMYDLWKETGVNPWTDKAMQKKHKTDFARNKKVKQCWTDHLNAPAHMHKGTSVE
jgi:hypothetical protein